MVIKYNKKRLFFIQLFSFCVVGFLGLSLWRFAYYELSLMSFLSFLPTVVLAWGLIYFQNGRYDDKKIIAPFAWPRIFFNDIEEVKSFAGDIVIKTQKRSFGINKKSADEASFQKFIEVLRSQTQIQINFS